MTKYAVNKNERERQLYAETMGKEAAERQAALADNCRICLSAPGEQHKVGCKGWPGSVRTKKARGRTTADS